MRDKHPARREAGVLSGAVTQYREWR